MHPQTGSGQENTAWPLIDLLCISIRTHLATGKIYMYPLPHDPHQTRNAPANDSGMYANARQRAEAW